MAAPVGDVDPTFSNITQEPKLTVQSPDRWVVFMDGMTVNGKNINGMSSFSVPGQQTGQTLANLDTGTSLAEIPQAYVDAIYKSAPGSQFFASQGVYILPCDTQINVSVVFAGVEYPVHPIDTVVATLDDNNQITCFSGFTTSSGDTSEDFLLGDSFLRNVYSLFDFGSFISNSSSAPFIQLLSTTNAAQAASEFNTLSAQRNQTLSGKSTPPNSSNTPHRNAASRTISSSSLMTFFGLCMGLLIL